MNWPWSLEYPSGNCWRRQARSRSSKDFTAAAVAWCFQCPAIALEIEMKAYEIGALTRLGCCFPECAWKLFSALSRSHPWTNRFLSAGDLFCILVSNCISLKISLLGCHKSAINMVHWFLYRPSEATLIKLHSMWKKQHTILTFSMPQYVLITKTKHASITCHGFPRESFG